MDDAGAGALLVTMSVPVGGAGGGVRPHFDAEYTTYGCKENFERTMKTAGVEVGTQVLPPHRQILHPKPLEIQPHVQSLRPSYMGLYPKKTPHSKPASCKRSIDPLRRRSEGPHAHNRRIQLYFCKAARSGTNYKTKSI